jgi:hypothetical protein
MRAVSAPTLHNIVAVPPGQGRWPDATVALLLAAHAVELVFEAAILLRTPDVDLAGAGHDISELNRLFRTLYSEPEFAWTFSVLSYRLGPRYAPGDRV